MIFWWKVKPCLWGIFKLLFSHVNTNDMSKPDIVWLAIPIFLDMDGKQTYHCISLIVQ